MDYASCAYLIEFADQVMYDPFTYTFTVYHAEEFYRLKLFGCLDTY